MTDVVEAYMQLGDFHKAVQASGLPTYVAYLKLLKSGCLKIQDKIHYGSEGAKRGAEAEELFLKLVPDAIDANRYFQKNNPVYDFMLNGMTIDVKYSSCRSDNGWSIRTSGEQDLIVAFLERVKGSRLDNPIVLVIPNAFIHQKQLFLCQRSAWLKDFCVDIQSLNDVVHEYAGVFS